jgi:putative PIN family toxin of toxin-antitoxin system
MSFRVVADTNVFISSALSRNTNSPNKEFVKRWETDEFKLIYTLGILAEYEEKLVEKGIREELVVSFLSLVIALGDEIELLFFHLYSYPVDIDDIAFLLCALNGRASHLVSHDHHLLSLRDIYNKEVTICKVLEFLSEIRSSQR